MGETCTENRAEAAPLVTVLVAVYNSEAFLRQCLDSLCAQTMDSVQIVCVDDASTDGSLAILRDYAARDGRVEVIALSENHGLAYARNKALERARGRYICFLDSDDWMSADSLEQACRTFDADDTLDALLFDTVYVYPDREEAYPMVPFARMSGKAYTLLGQRYIRGSRTTILHGRIVTTILRGCITMSRDKWAAARADIITDSMKAP